ncbi:MAG: type II toxin-antitoxin system PemK/MazF family toxin [Candidatus Kapabacteria bacterium]|nr:type II toxin-antitoxin system PemK/MazF family toxin [Candidatus Kapabacteria bacterium]
MKFFTRDIIIVPFPFSNLTQYKQRPAIVISNYRLNSTNDVIIAQMSSVIRNDNFSFLIEDFMLDNLLVQRSEVRTNKILTIEKSLIIKTIARMNEKPYYDLIEKILSNIRTIPT